MQEQAKRLLRSDTVRRFVCWLIHLYIRLVYATSRWTVEGADIARWLRAENRPFILAFWHGRLSVAPRRSVMQRSKIGAGAPRGACPPNPPRPTAASAARPSRPAPWRAMRYAPCAALRRAKRRERAHALPHPHHGARAGGDAVPHTPAGRRQGGSRPLRRAPGRRRARAARCAH